MKSSPALPRDFALDDRAGREVLDLFAGDQLGLIGRRVRAERVEDGGVDLGVHVAEVIDEIEIDHTCCGGSERVAPPNLSVRVARSKLIRRRPRSAVRSIPQVLRAGTPGDERGIDNYRFMFGGSNRTEQRNVQAVHIPRINAAASSRHCGAMCNRRNRSCR
jgi:hypothetical protein